MGGRTRKLRNRARREGLVQADRFDAGSVASQATPAAGHTAPEAVKFEPKTSIKTTKKPLKKL